MHSLSRRRFVQQMSAGAALALVPAGIARAEQAMDADATAQTLTEGWEHLRMPLAGPFEVWTQPPIADWDAVVLPHCFNSADGCDPDAPAYRGKGWYRRHLEVANPYPGGRTLLHFEGAGQSCEVYVGATLAGGHTGGYDEFVVDITEAVAQASAKDKQGIRLAVLCDSSPDLERIPSDLSDFTLYGGLYRDVHLLYVPSVSLEMVHVRTKTAAGRPASVHVRARLYNPRATVGQAKLRIAILNDDGSELRHAEVEHAFWAGSLELAAFTIENPRLWSPDRPQLYRCRVTLTSVAGESVHLARFGVRFFEFAEHGPFFLNGQRLAIRGTHRHEDHAGYAAAMPAALIRQEMQLIREMGANFVRLAHYQQRSLVLDLCDELGLMVWEELPWCRAGIGDEAFQQQGREKLTTMIEQHFNHPAILLWGLGNEDDWEQEYPAVDKEAIRRYMQELNALAHRLDDGRLTSYRRCDFARDIPDVYSPSVFAGWYGGRFVDYEASITAQFKKSTRMLHAEWGADSHAGRHAEDPYKTLQKVPPGDTAERGAAYLLKGATPRVSSDGDWSESYACDLFDWHLKVQASLPWLSGAAQWVFKDFTTPLRPENPVPRVNQKGVVARDMTRKESFYVFQSYWTRKPMAHIYGHTWPVRWGAEGEPRTVKVYSNCASAELFVNGTSAGVRKRDSQDFPAAGLRWETPFVSGRNRLRVVAQADDGARVVDEISFVYQTEVWGAGARLSLTRIAQSETRTTVEALLLDKDGVLCLDARNAVRFSLAGEGRLIDNRGTATASRVVQLCNGRARIDIATRGPGTAGVSSKGIEAGFCSV